MKKIGFFFLSVVGAHQWLQDIKQMAPEDVSFKFSEESGARLAQVHEVFQEFNTVLDERAQLRKWGQKQQTPVSHHTLKHPVVGEGEGENELCPADEVVDGVCTISDRVIKFKKTQHIKLPEVDKLVISNTTLTCKMDIEQACDLLFTLPKENSAIEIRKGSLIHGESIFFLSDETSLLIDDSSMIDVSGSSMHTKGTDPDSRQGGSYIGEGGFCGSNPPKEKTYGEFNMKPRANPQNLLDFKLIGSIGQDRKKATGGGGHVHIQVDSIALEGNNTHIKASGFPLWEDYFEDDLQGGSGGYVYIKAAHQHRNSSLDLKARIEALGGTGQGKGFGGAGGVIYIENIESMRHYRQAFADGGKSGSYWATQTELEVEPLCQNGAPGTVYFSKNDYLFIDNILDDSSRKTRIQAHPSEGQHALATYTHIGNSSQVVISSGDNVEVMMFQTLLVRENSSVILDFPNSKKVILKMTRYFLFDASSLLDASSISNGVSIEASAVEGEEAYNYQTIHLGQINFNQLFRADAKYLYFNGKVHDSSDTSGKSRIELISTHTTLQNSSELKAGKVFVFAEDTVSMEDSAKVSSTHPNMCTMSKNGNLDMYQCIDPDQIHTFNITREEILEQYNRQYDYKVGNPNFATYVPDMVSKILGQWNVYVMALNFFYMNEAKITGPRIGACSSYYAVFSSVIDASEKGCLSNQGLGAGRIVDDCAGSGAAHGGYGGVGDPEDKSISNSKCLSEFPEPYYFGNEARYEGSGGAGGDGEGRTGGSGGGIVWLTNPRVIYAADTKVIANGGPGKIKNFDQQGSGGGAGGSIQITTEDVLGTAIFSVSGGDGRQGGGGGSGGRIVVNRVKNYLMETYERYFTEWMKSKFIAFGGRGGPVYGADKTNGEKGSILPSKCLPGYEGILCTMCPVGTFKSEFSVAPCIPCENKPEHSYYISEGMSSSICDYECTRPRESSEHNLDCLSPIELEVQRMGGTFPFFIMMIVFFLISLVILITLSSKVENLRFRNKNLPYFLYEVWDSKEYRNRGRTSEENTGIRDDDIFAHTHRMYLVGNNSFNFPWEIPKDMPRTSLQLEDMKKLIAFIDDYNQKLKYTAFERYSFKLLSILFFPAARHYHFYMRIRKFEALRSALYNHFPPQFWGDKGSNKTLRFNCCKDDYQLAYIDFLDYQYNEENWRGLKLPMPILLAGSGTFNNPYSFQYQHDPVVKSLIFMNKNLLRPKLHIFFENLNSQLSKLSFFKLNHQTMRDLSKTVRWIENANKSMFNYFGVKCVLYICENQYKEYDTGKYSQRRRSFPLETVFFESFPEMYLKLLTYIQQKSIVKKSEFRLVMCFKEFNTKKQFATQLRVQTMQAEEGMTRFKTAVAKQESILFDVTDSSEHESYVKYMNLQYDSEETKMGEKVKVVNSTLQAFSLSISSSKAFEVAIRKPRNKLKHIFAEGYGKLYGLYLLLVKHHGSPAERRDILKTLLIFSMTLALDLLVTIYIMLEIFRVEDDSNNYDTFGWVFMDFYFGMPLFAPLMMYMGSFSTDYILLQEASNFNAIVVMCNIPAAFFACMFWNDDPVYLLIFLVMIAVKMMLSTASSKVRHHIRNPRFEVNQRKLRKIMSKQERRKMQRYKAFGVEPPKPEVQRLEDGRVAYTHPQDPLEKMGANMEKLNERLLDC